MTTNPLSPTWWEVVTGSLPPPTPCQQQILDAIKGHIQAHGYAPTVREIGAMCGLRSSATVAQHLDVLKRKGCIEWHRGKSRTIRLMVDTPCRNSGALQ